MIKDATVQGSNAPTSVANGTHYLDRNEDVDTIIVGRGGGSDTDLMAFNQETVSEAIVTASTPVIVAVGQTEDRTIAGRVADVDAITPTEAGESAVASLEQFRTRELAALEEDLDAAYEAFEREHEHEKELAAVEQAQDSIQTSYYKAAIVGLLILLGIVLFLWLVV